MPLLAPPAPLPDPDADPDAARRSRASGSVTVLTLEELSLQLRSLRPPPAYRLSLDSGVQYKNVRRAFEHPWTVRLDTWLRLLRSLEIRIVAAARAEHLFWPHEQGLLVAFGMDAAALADPAAATSLRGCRMHRGWSRRELARRAGVSVDAVASAEAGRGLVGKLARVCDCLGLRLLLALPPRYASLDELWAEHAARCLAQPEHYRRTQRSGRTPWTAPGEMGG